jgi:hypothetical protein
MTDVLTAAVHGALRCTAFSELAKRYRLGKPPAPMTTWARKGSSPVPVLTWRRAVIGPTRSVNLGSRARLFAITKAVNWY